MPLLTIGPLALSRDAMQRVSAALADSDLRPVAAADDGDDVPGALQVRDGVAIVDACGALYAPRGGFADLLADLFGGCSYQVVRARLDEALARADVRGIVLRISSPGGDVDGCGELADAIYAARGTKPIVAYIEGSGCSAAYWLASQAGRIVAFQTAMIGSIGVRVDLIDESGAEKRAGLAVTEIVSSSAPGKRSRPVDDDVRARVQTKVDDLEAVFVDAVARGRGVPSATVYADFLQGDYAIAAKALDAGMIDAIGDLASVVATLATGSSRPAFPRSPMQVAAAARRTRAAEAFAEIRHAEAQLVAKGITRAGAIVVDLDKPAKRHRTAATTTATPIAETTTTPERPAPPAPTTSTPALDAGEEHATMKNGNHLTEADIGRLSRMYARTRGIPPEQAREEVRRAAVTLAPQMTPSLRKELDRKYPVADSSDPDIRETDPSGVQPMKLPPRMATVAVAGSWGDLYEQLGSSNDPQAAAVAARLMSAVCRAMARLCCVQYGEAMRLYSLARPEAYRAARGIPTPSRPRVERGQIQQGYRVPDDVEEKVRRAEAEVDPATFLDTMRSPPLVGRLVVEQSR
jgi:ClpP class serine protease